MSYLMELDQKGSMATLLMLMEGEKNITELREIKGVGLNALYNALEGLKKIGLISERTGSHQARLFSLTAKGKKIVLHIKTIYEELAKK